MSQLITVAVLACAVPLAAQRPIRVYVSPVLSVEGFVDEQQQRKADSRKDLIEELRRDRTLQIVDDATAVDVAIEVVSSQMEERSDTSTTSVRNPLTGIVSSRTEKPRVAMLRVELSAATYKTEIHTRGEPVLWSSAADSVASQIRRWIRDNRKQLLAKSPQ